MQRFGEKLRALRSLHRFTLVELSSHLGYSTHSHLSAIESGRKLPTVELVLKVASFFNVTTDQLLHDHLELFPLQRRFHPQREISYPMALPLAERPPTAQELERFRLIFSTYQDGSGMLPIRGTIGRTLPGWRDFERSIALAFNGQAQEDKSLFDVLIPFTDVSNTYYGLSCKMRATLKDTRRTGRVTIELSNAAKKFWTALANANINSTNYSLVPDIVGSILLQVVDSWHQKVSIEQGGLIDVSRSSYLTLSWDERVGEYQLHQFPLQHPDPRSLLWTFSGARIIGEDGTGKLVEWYGESGGQLKYYPPITQATWISDVFSLEPLDDETYDYGILARAALYFPSQWDAIQSNLPEE